MKLRNSNLVPLEERTIEERLASNSKQTEEVSRERSLVQLFSQYNRGPLKNLNGIVT